MKLLISAVFFALVSLTFPIYVNASEFAENETQDVKEETLEAKISEILVEEEIKIQEFTGYYQRLRLYVEKGSLAGRTIEVENGNNMSPSNRSFKVGDRLLVVYTKGEDGEDIFFINDYVRRQGLIFLFLAFSLLVILIGGFWGAASIVGMAASFLVIFKFILPQILQGKDPVLTAILGSSIIVPLTFSLSHGLKVKTLIAAVGTIVTLIVVGVWADLAISTLHLSGFSAEEATFLQFDVKNILNMKGILLAGMIIATLGVLDDITISQASLVSELKEANKKYDFKKLFQKGMNVGRDHIASLVNTLILVYAGASLPMLLLFSNNLRPVSEVINYENIAEEVVRTLVGSIGLVIAVPITTLLAAYYFSRK